jgi:hypothetical protein
MQNWNHAILRVHFTYRAFLVRLDTLTNSKRFVCLSIHVYLVVFYICTFRILDHLHVVGVKYTKSVNKAVIKWVLNWMRVFRAIKIVHSILCIPYWSIAKSYYLFFYYIRNPFRCYTHLIALNLVRSGCKSPVSCGLTTCVFRLCNSWTTGWHLF